MGYKPVSNFSTTLSSGVTLSDEIDLGRGWDLVSVEIPTMTSGTDVYFQAAATSGGTYRRLHHRLTASDDSPVAMNVNSSITQAIVPLEFVQSRYLKIELSTAMTATSAQFNVICS